MNHSLTIFNNLTRIVAGIFSSLSLNNRTHPKGRKPVLGNIEAVALAIFARRQSVTTKKALYEIMEPLCSYNTFVRTLNRCLGQLAYITGAIMSLLEKDAHPVKHTDSTDIPVCLVKNGKSHRTMRGIAAWSKTGKGWFYGLKLHLSSDLKGRILALRLTPGNSDDRAIFRKMNEKLRGIFVADAGYISGEIGARLPQGERANADCHSESKHAQDSDRGAPRAHAHEDARGDPLPRPQVLLRSRYLAPPINRRLPCALSVRHLRVSDRLIIQRFLQLCSIESLCL